jgi:aryl-alcohol dehydrogenase-like predicted oxidoreductase
MQSTRSRMLRSRFPHSVMRKTLAKVNFESQMSIINQLTLGIAVISTAEELEIPVLAYSPQGWGFFTGAFRSLDDFPADDMRRHFDRFQPEVNRSCSLPRRIFFNDL